MRACSTWWSVSPQPSMMELLVTIPGTDFLACSKTDRLCLYPARGSRTNLECIRNRSQHVGLEFVSTVPLEVFHCFNVVGIHIQSRLGYQVHMLHGTPEIRGETFDKNGVIPEETKKIIHISAHNSEAVYLSFISLTV